MVKPFDVTKFRKNITKSIDGLGIGFNDPTDWISTGNHALNYLISGDFYKGIPLGKVTVFAGESGSGKSYICSGNIIREAQKQDIFVILVDSENALDEAGFLSPSEKKPAMARNIRNMLMRTKMTEQDIRTFRGMINALLRWPLGATDSEMKARVLAISRGDPDPGDKK